MVFTGRKLIQKCVKGWTSAGESFHSSHTHTHRGRQVEYVWASVRHARCQCVTYEPLRLPSPPPPSPHFLPPRGLGGMWFTGVVPCHPNGYPMASRINSVSSPSESYTSVLPLAHPLPLPIIKLCLSSFCFVISPPPPHRNNNNPFHLGPVPC